MWTWRLHGVGGNRIGRVELIASSGENRTSTSTLYGSAGCLWTWHLQLAAGGWARAGGMNCFFIMPVEIAPSVLMGELARGLGACMRSQHLGPGQTDGRHVDLALARGVAGSRQRGQGGWNEVSS